jgi:hypothetical protein
MKVIRLSYWDSDNGCCLSWHRNKSEAEKHLSHLSEDGRLNGDGPTTIKTVEIPTDKDGLIDWLNANFDTDNG